MTSIFNTSYKNNLSRVNSSSSDRVGEKSSATHKGEHFKKVLGDLEQQPKIVNNAALLAQSAEKLAKQAKLSAPPAPIITNIADAEMIDHAPVPHPTPRDADISASDPLFRTVKFDNAPVKFLAPETVSSPLKGSGPETPVIATIDRIEPKPAEVRPGAPRLARITRQDNIRLEGEKPVTPKHAIKEIILTAGKFYGVDPNLSMAVAQAESSFQPHAVSSDGHESKGIFQLLDKTGQHMLERTGLENEDYDPFDPAQNAYLGVGYLRRLHDIFSAETDLGGNMKTYPASSAEHLEKLAVAAFNAGEGSVARAQARAQSVGKDPADFSAIEPYLPASTRQYVQRVSTLRDHFAAANVKNKTV